MMELTSSRLFDDDQWQVMLQCWTQVEGPLANDQLVDMGLLINHLNGLDLDVTQWRARLASVLSSNRDQYQRFCQFFDRWLAGSIQPVEKHIGSEITGSDTERPESYFSPAPKQQTDSPWWQNFIPARETRKSILTGIAVISIIISLPFALPKLIDPEINSVETRYKPLLVQKRPPSKNGAGVPTLPTLQEKADEELLMISRSLDIQRGQDQVDISLDQTSSDSIKFWNRLALILIPLVLLLLAGWYLRSRFRPIASATRHNEAHVQSQRIGSQSEQRIVPTGLLTRWLAPLIEKRGLSRKIDAQKTAHASARSLYLPKLIYQARKTPLSADCVILLEQISAPDQSAYLFKALREAANARHVSAQMFRYQGNADVLWPVDDSRGIHHRELRKREGNAPILLVSEFDAVWQDGRLVDWVDELNRNGPVILLARNLEQGQRLRLDKKQLAYTTFDRLDELFNSLNQVQRSARQSQHSQRTTTIPFVDVYEDELLDDEANPEIIDRWQQLIEQLQDYLGPGGYRALIGIALFPLLHWQITRFWVHEAYRAAPSQDQGLAQHDLLLRMTQLPWLRHHYMPEWLRQRLLDGDPDWPEQLRTDHQRVLDWAAERIKNELLAPNARRHSSVFDQPMVARLKWYHLFTRLKTGSPLRDYLVAKYVFKPSLFNIPLPDWLTRWLSRSIWLNRLAAGAVILTALILSGAGGILWHQNGYKHLVDENITAALEQNFQLEIYINHHADAQKNAQEIGRLLDTLNYRVYLNEDNEITGDRIIAPLPSLGDLENLLIPALWRENIPVGISPVDNLARVDIGPSWSGIYRDQFLDNSKDGLISYTLPVSGANPVSRALPVELTDLSITALIRPEMVEIPAGSFTMGSPDSEPGRNSDEGPQRTVQISAFQMGRTEVTRAEFHQFVESTGHVTDAEKQDGCFTWNDQKTESVQNPQFNWLEPGIEQGESHPVVCVSWNDAKAYIAWLNESLGLSEADGLYRLPTEAEWEYATRAGTDGPFSFDGPIDTDKANYDGTYTYDDSLEGVYRQTTVPVSSLPANPWGLHEVHGNVWEWVEDCWHESYTDAPADDRAWLEGNEGDCGIRVLRGGSWAFEPDNLRAAYRVYSNPFNAVNYVGFRLARTHP